MESGSKSFQDVTDEMLKDPELAAMYLEEILQDGDIDQFLFALRNVASAQAGSMKAFSDKTKLGRESLYKSLSKSGNPKLDTVTKILNAIGLRLSVTTLTASQAR